MKIDFPFAALVDLVKNKPDDLSDYARQQMGLVKEMLHVMPPFACTPSCNQCCHGTILMSYVEYVHILNCLLAQGGVDGLGELFSCLGVLEEEDKLLCPFINDLREKEHCSIYAERPLICRVFGTSAAPCEEEIEYPSFSEALFYKAYDLLYYMETGNFIRLPLEDGLALYEAPFDIWAIADSGRTTQLMELFKLHGSMRAVLYDTQENRFFAISGGQRHYLE